MNMFGGFTQGGFSVLGQALESLGSIVAPIPDEEEEEKFHSKSGDGEENGKEIEETTEAGDDATFDNIIQNYIQQKRVEQPARPKLEKKLLHKPSSAFLGNDKSDDKADDVDLHAKEPESPNSLVTIALDDELAVTPNPPSIPPPVPSFIHTSSLEQEDSLSTLNENRKYSTSSDLESPLSTSTPTIQIVNNSIVAKARAPPLTNSSFATFSSAELEKKVQLKYRENLEYSYQELQSQYQELIQENYQLHQKLQDLEAKQQNLQQQNQQSDKSPSLNKAVNIAVYEKKIGELEKFLFQLQSEIKIKEETIQQFSSKQLQLERLEKEKQEILKENQLLNLNNQDLFKNLEERQQQLQQLSSQYQKLQQEHQDQKHQLSFEKQLVIESEQLQQKHSEAIKLLKQEKDKILKDSQLFMQQAKEKEQQLRSQVDLLEKFAQENESVQNKYEKLIDNHRLENQELLQTVKGLEEKLVLLETNYVSLQEQHNNLIQLNQQQQQQQLRLSSSSSASTPIRTVDNQNLLPILDPPNSVNTDISMITIATSPIPNPYQDMLLKIFTNYLDAISTNIQQFCLDHQIPNVLPSVTKSSSFDHLTPATSGEETLFQYIFHSIQLFENMIELTKNELIEWKDSSLVSLQILQKLLLRAFPECQTEVQQLFDPSLTTEAAIAAAGKDEKLASLPDNSIHRIVVKLCQILDVQLRGYQEREKTNQEVLRKEVLIFNEKEEQLSQKVKSLVESERLLKEQLQVLSTEIQQKSVALLKAEQERDHFSQLLKQSNLSDQQSKQQLHQLSSDSQHKLTLLSKLEQERDTLQQQFQEVKAKFVKTDNENKQLLTVINQLRNARKDKTSENEQMIQELSTLREQYQSLQKEFQDSKSFKEQYHHLSTKFQLLTNDYQTKLKEMTHLQQEITTYESTIQHYSSQLLQKEQSLYEKQQLLENHLYEEKLLKKTIEHLTLENNNLKNIYNDYEQQSALEVNLWKRKYQDCLQHYEQLQQSQQQLLQQSKDSLMEQFHQEREQLINQIQEKTLQMKQLIFENQQEKKLLQKNIEKTIVQLQNTTNNVVDKILIGNLIVSYFQRRRSREVLELIAKVLQLNDEQLVIIGLKVPNINYLQSFFQTVIGINTAAGEEESLPVEGASLAELWVNHLIKQAEAPPKPKPSSSGVIAAAGAASPKASASSFNSAIMKSSSTDSNQSK